MEATTTLSLNILPLSSKIVLAGYRMQPYTYLIKISWNRRFTSAIIISIYPSLSMIKRWNLPYNITLFIKFLYLYLLISTPIWDFELFQIITLYFTIHAFIQRKVTGLVFHLKDSRKITFAFSFINSKNIILSPPPPYRISWKRNQISLGS